MFPKMNAKVESILREVDEAKRLIDEARPLPSPTVQALQDDFTIRYAHETTAIEGNTLSLRETQVVLEDGITIGGKTIREHLEVLNVREALNWLTDFVQNKDSITDRTVLDIHHIIMEGILKEDAGRYRRDPVYIRGAWHVPPNWIKIPRLMDDLSNEIAKGPEGEHPIVFASQAHVKLVQIHPFIDGNGRTARLLTSILLMQQGYPAAMYTSGKRAEYLEALSQADAGNLDPFILVTAEAIRFLENRYLALIAQQEQAQKHLRGPKNSR